MVESDHTWPARGRVYTVPFDRVWRAATELLSPVRGWRPLSADANLGEIRVERPSRILRRPLRLRLSVALDEHGFTRVEARFVAADWVRTARGKHRRTRRILRHLDRAVAAEAVH